MQGKLLPIRVEYTDEFKSNLKRLSKRYRNIQSDITPLIEQLLDRQCPGDRIQGTRYVVYKIRVTNSDIDKGKSGGYRVVYQLRTDADKVVLITIYSKSEQTDIQPHQINAIIER